MSPESDLDTQDGLPEERFIRQRGPRDKGPMWLWGGVCLSLVALAWGLSAIADSGVFDDEEAPFFRVTNREMSQFLWQHPEFMRRHAMRKTGYLPGFQSKGREGMVVEQADALASGPPELFYRYHTWQRLIGDVVFTRKIAPTAFKQFLRDEPAWHPEKWAAATDEYKQTVRLLNTYDELSALSELELPAEVRRAFIGWMNYFDEGDAINALVVSVGELKAFLLDHPEYRRSLWRNVVADGIPDYLGVTLGAAEDGDIVPTGEMTPFFRVAYYNLVVAQQAS